MRDTEAALTDDVDVAARLDLVTYLLRCTGDVAVVSASTAATTDAAVPALVRAVAGDRETAAVVIDSATANHAERLASRLMLDAEQRPGDADAAATLAGRLKDRRRSLAVIVPGAHGLPVPLVRDLVILGRRIAARGAAMPLALICPEAEAERLQALVQETGRGAEQIHHIRLQTPEDPRPMPLMERPRLNPLWVALPVVALVAVLLGMQQWASAPAPANTDGPAVPPADTPPTVTSDNTDREHPSQDGDEPATDALATETGNTPADPASPEPPPEPAGLPPEIAFALRSPSETLPPAEDIPVARRPDETSTPDDTPIDIAATDPTTDNGNVAPSRQVESRPSNGAASGDDENASADTAADTRQPTDTRKPAQPASAAATSETEDSSTPADDPTPASGTDAGNDDATATDTEKPAPPGSRDWLASRPADHYTLQLIAGRQEATTRRFLADHPDVREQARVVEIDDSDGRWFLVLLGDYPSRSAAMAAVPGSIGADNVYVRRFGSIRR